MEHFSKIVLLQEIEKQSNIVFLEIDTITKEANLGPIFSVRKK